MLLLFFSGAANNIAGAVGVEALGQTGTINVSSNAKTFAIGVSATGMAGRVVVPQHAMGSVVGVQALGIVGGAIVWGHIMPRWDHMPGEPSDIWTEIVPKKLW